MSEGMTRFEKLVKDEKCGSIKKILRVKNMFSMYAGSHDKFANLALNKFSYCDVKMNVLVNHNGKAIIGEVQFLLQFMSKAKAMVCFLCFVFVFAFVKHHHDTRIKL